MSQKYKLVQDHDDDSWRGSIQRHLKAFLFIIVVPMAALLILGSIMIINTAREAVILEQHRASAAATRAAIPTSTPTPVPTVTPTPFPPVHTFANGDTLLYSGPGFSHIVLRDIEAGTPLPIIGRDATGQWYEVGGGGWLNSAFVANFPLNLPMTAP